MGFLIHKPKGLAFSGVKKLAIITFITLLSFALIDTIFAVYVDSFFNNISMVGFFSAFLSLVSLVSFFLIIPTIERSSKSKIFSYSLFFIFISYILFAINRNFYVFFILAVFVTVINCLRITSFGIIVRDKSSEKNLSRNEGVMYCFMNLAYLIGPIVAGFVSEKFGVNIVFVLSGFFILIALLIFRIFKIKDKNIKKKIDKNVFKDVVDFFKNKNRVLAYLLGGGVNFWWSLIYLFIPVYIIENGFSIRLLGFFLFLVAIPLVSFSYYFSKLAGKIGFKKIFKIGFLIPAVICLVCFFIGNIYLILGLLVLASVGLAMLEAPTEAYFFDILKKKQELKFYSTYNTTIDLNHFVGRGLAALLLLFLPFKFIFLFFSLIMFGFFIVAGQIKNVVESKRGRNNKVKL